jgi:uncharacterized protein
MTEGREPARRLYPLLYSDGRLRAPWRIAAYLALFFALGVLGQVFVAVAPAPGRMWLHLAVLTLASAAAGWILLGTVENRPPGAMGFPLDPSAVRESITSTGLGMGLLGLVAVLVLLGGGGFVRDEGTVSSYVGMLAWTLVFFALAAAFEEILFRGYAFQVLVEWVGGWAATLVAAALFAVLHAANPHVGWLALTNIFLAGVLLSVIYLQTRSLWWATGVHLGWNWSMATLFDFPVSGLAYDTPLYDLEVRGPGWWSGGAFGPEGGVAATLVLLAATLWLVRGRPLAPSAAALERRPIVDRRRESWW